MSYSIKLSNNNSKVEFYDSDRGLCDEYSPCVNHIVCELLEEDDIYIST